MAAPDNSDESPARPTHTCPDPVPKTVVELIHSLLTDTGNTVRTLAMVVVPLVVLACVIHALKLPAGHIIKDVTRHSVTYLAISSFAGGGLLTGGVARAKKRLKKRSGSASDG
jgi:hypothetical protein